MRENSVLKFTPSVNRFELDYYSKLARPKYVDIYGLHPCINLWRTWYNYTKLSGEELFFHFQKSIKKDITIPVLLLPLFSRDKVVKLRIFSLFKAKEEIFDVEKKKKKE